MCGIVGYIGEKTATPILFEGLKRLEYRGYDSAGIAILTDGELSIHRAQGKLKNLIDQVGASYPKGHAGIGHTRWATHGRPSEINAHPHQAGRVVLVHNGIVENYQALRVHLEKHGAQFQSETDTEVICHLINAELKKHPDFFTAFRQATSKLEGTYALAVLDTEDQSQFYAARKSSPLVVGLGKGENFVASDIPAVLAHTKNFVFMDDGEFVVVKKEVVEFFDSTGCGIKKTPKQIDWSAEAAEKGGYKHFMLKEIFEQPRAVEDTLRGRLLKATQTVDLPGLDQITNSEKKHGRFYIVACGTSWHAAMAGRYMIEALARMPVAVDTASEFRYREPFIDDKTILLVISQSGETADTLACVQDAKKRGATVIAICNAMESSIPRASDLTFYTQAGPEIGVASTKAFTTQLTLLLMMGLSLGKNNGTLNADYIKRAVAELSHLPHLMNSVLAQNESIKKIAQKYHQARDFYFIARGVHFPIALEGALKLKEISYIHAEGYAAGEMKHGPIALIEQGTPVVALAPRDRVCEKMISNLQEARARGAKVIAIITEGDDRFQNNCDDIITIPETAWYITPILISLPLQLLAYFIADLKGEDVDQPRNLAKSVTVE